MEKLDVRLDAPIPGVDHTNAIDHEQLADVHRMVDDRAAALGVSRFNDVYVYDGEYGSDPVRWFSASGGLATIRALTVHFDTNHSTHMAAYKLRINDARPYFAELPYYLWGQVNYDSEGDCKNPLDRNWTWMELTHRDTNESLDISSDGTEWAVTGPDPAAARIAYFMQQRCAAQPLGTEPETNLQEWDRREASSRASRVESEFQNELLVPFATGHMFWGSWKWIGWFGTDFTWVGRWIMDSVVRNDPRAVNLCIEWLRDGTVAESQSSALRYALGRLTGMSHPTDKEWVRWYDSGGKQQFPEPDFSKWYQDLKVIHGE